MDQEKWDRNLVNQVPVHFLRCETGSFADAHNEKQPLAIVTYIQKLVRGSTDWSDCILFFTGKAHKKFSSVSITRVNH